MTTVEGIVKRLIALVRTMPLWLAIVLAALFGPWAIGAWLYWFLLAIRSTVGLEVLFPRVW